MHTAARTRTPIARRPLGRRESHLVWTKLIESLVPMSKSVASAVARVVRRLGDVVRDYLGELLAFGGKIEEYELSSNAPICNAIQRFSSVPTAGVDSSRTGVIPVGHIHFAAVSSATIVYPRGLPVDEDSVSEFVYADPIQVPEYADSSYVEIELNMKMFDEELKALDTAVNNLIKLAKEFNEKSVVLCLDGPIVDPPKFLSTAKRAGESFSRKYMEYVKARVNGIKRVMDAGGIVVGIVKRIRGSMFLDFISVNSIIDSSSTELLNSIKRANLGDKHFVMYVSEVLRENLHKDGKDFTIVFKPFPLPKGVTDVELYRSYGIDVYSFYLVPRLYGMGRESAPIRVEIAVKSNASSSDVLEYVRKAVGAIHAWLIPGLNVPEPVLVAHYRCSIRKREAKKLLKEFATRALYEASKSLDEESAYRILRLIGE